MIRTHRALGALTALVCAGFALPVLPTLAQPAAASAPELAAVPADTVCHVPQPQPLADWPARAAYRARATVRDGRVVSTEVRALTPGVEQHAQRAFVLSINDALRQAQCAGNHLIEQQIVFGPQAGGAAALPAGGERCSGSEGEPAPTVEWSGACVAHLADGPGRLQVLDAHGQLLYRHEGRMKAGLRDGEGVTTRADGSRVEGQFTQDRLEGRGRIAFANGDVYDGEWRAGIASGDGQLTFARGDSYTGRLRAGQLGTGLFRWADGASYRGGFAGNRPSGPGELRFADGAVLSTRFVAGQPHGPAQLRLPEGGSYQAEFQRGLLKTSDQDVLNAPYLRLKRLRVPVPAPLGPLNDSRSVALACTAPTRFEVPDFGWKGRAVYHATVDVKTGAVQAVAVRATQPSGDSGVDKRFVEALEQTIRTGLRCTGDARIERSYVVEMR